MLIFLPVFLCFLGVVIGFIFFLKSIIIIIYIGHTYFGKQNTDLDIWSTRQLKIKIMALCYNPTMNQFVYCIVSALSFFLFLSFSIPSFRASFLQSFLLFFWSLILVWLELILCLHEIGSSSMQFFCSLFPPPSASVWRVAVASCPHLQFGAVEFETEVKYTGGFVFTPSSPTKQNKSNRKLEKEKKKQKWVLRQSSAGSSFHFDVNCNLL